jgi:transcriptional regulator with XRE-family HTH domain
MVRVPLTPQDHERGRRLGEVLRAARGERSMTSVAAAVGMSPETLRKIETGRVPTPAFFTVVALCGELGVPLEQVAEQCADQYTDQYSEPAPSRTA